MENAVDLIFADETTGVPEWLGVWNGLTGGRRRIMPVQGARQVGGEVHVPWTKEQIEQAPHYHEGIGHDDPHDVHVTREMEEQAYGLYGVQPLSPPPAEAYVYRFRAVVVSRRS